MRFEDKTLLLGVMGSIAAFQAADIASALVKEGAMVHCVMTQNATQFITPLTMQTLSRNPVQVGSIECGKDWKPQHIHTLLIPLMRCWLHPSGCTRDCSWAWVFCEWTGFGCSQLYLSGNKGPHSVFSSSDEWEYA